MTIEEPDRFETLGEEIAEEVSRRASAIECPASEYREGLREILRAVRSQIETDIQASEETDR